MSAFAGKADIRIKPISQTKDLFRHHNKTLDFCSKGSGSVITTQLSQGLVSVAAPTWRLHKSGDNYEHPNDTI